MSLPCLSLSWTCKHLPDARSSSTCADTLDSRGWWRDCEEIKLCLSTRLSKKKLLCCSPACLAQSVQGGRRHSWSTGLRACARTLAPVPGGSDQESLQIIFFFFSLYIYVCLQDSVFSISTQEQREVSKRWGRHRVPSPLPWALRASLAPRAGTLWRHLVLSPSLKQINTTTPRGSRKGVGLVSVSQLACVGVLCPPGTHLLARGGEAAVAAAGRWVFPLRTKII